MKNIERIYSKKIPLETRDFLMKEILNFVASKTPVKEIIFFGSVLTDRFDAYSDIDVIAIYESPIVADQARRILYKTQLPETGHSLEILCVDQKTFRQKSQIGGIYAVAHEEGKVFDFSR